MMDYQSNIDYIIDKLSAWRTKIYLNNKLGLYNLSVLSENIVRDILNIIFEKEKYKFQNANLFVPNVDSIDLKDELNKIAVQVTTNNTYKKIKYTVQKFVDNGHHHEYEKLLIVIVDEKDGKEKREDYSYNEYKFDIKNVLYLDDIVKLIKDLPLDKIGLIRYYLEQEHEKYKLDAKEKKLKEKLKKEKFINFPIVDRRIKSVNQEYVFGEKNEKAINEILLNNKGILILGDASCGKTTYLKDVADKINETDLYFGIYKRLNTFSNENDFETYLLEDYSFISKDRIILILDGLDEIEEKYRKDFIKKLLNFSEGKNITIIMSCRSNIYNEINILKEYKEYILCDLNKDDISKFFNLYGLNFDEIINESKYREYGFLIHNPFYLKIICEHYKKTNKLLNRKSIISCAISDILEEDRKKYSITLDYLDKIQCSQRTAIQRLGFVLECLGRNYVSDSELKQIVKKDYEYLTYCGLLKKDGENWGFIHNNFGEYLASEELKKYDYKEITKIILDKKDIKFSWQNTLSFYLANNQDKKLIKLIIDNKPKLICNIEKDRFSDAEKLSLFKKIVDPYMNKKIWIPWDILQNNRLFEFFATKQVYEYLKKIIIKNEYYVTTSNALEILNELVYYIKDDELEGILKSILLSNEYNKYHKKRVFHVLANAKIGNKNFLLEIINRLKKEENQYIRAGYFYYINHMGLVDELVEDIFDYRTVVGRMIKAKWISDDDAEDTEPTLLDENIEYVELFKNIHCKNSINIIIEKLKKNSDRSEKFDAEILKNLCLSVDSINIEEKEKNDLLIELYFIFFNQGKQDEIKYLRDILLPKNERFRLFKRHLENYQFSHRYELINLVDEECAKYFYEEYEKGHYSDEIANDILFDIPTNSKYFCYIKNQYKKNTGKDWDEPYKPLSLEEKNCLKQKYFDSLFDKKIYIENIKYVFDIIEEETIILKKLPYIRHKSGKHLWDDVIFDLTSHFLYRIKNSDTETILKKDVEKRVNELDWDYVIINEVSEFLKNEKNIKISKKQIAIIEKICINKLSDLDYNTAIVSQDNRCFSIKGNIYIVLAELRKQLNLKYPKKVLLDMLMFEPFQDYKNDKIQSIIDEVGFDECKDRILYNIRNLNLISFVLESYLEFFIKYEIYSEAEVVYNYLKSPKTSSYTKNCCIKYIVKSKNKRIINKVLKCLNTFNDEDVIQIVRCISDESPSTLHLLRSLYTKINNGEAKKIFVVWRSNTILEEGIKNIINILNKQKKHMEWILIRMFQKLINYC